MPAFFGYLAGVILLVSAVALGAMKLSQPQPGNTLPANIVQKAAAQPIKATAYAAKRKPAIPHANKTAKLAASKRVPHSQPPHIKLPPQFAGIEHDPAGRNLGYAAETAPTPLFDRRFR